MKCYRCGGHHFLVEVIHHWATYKVCAEPFVILPSTKGTRPVVEAVTCADCSAWQDIDNCVELLDTLLGKEWMSWDSSEPQEIEIK